VALGEYETFCQFMSDYRSKNPKEAVAEGEADPPAEE